tara:strand:+ start:131 stop:397 length:267 start_codon:yes stop_codon:yes gene_type:complete
LAIVHDNHSSGTDERTPNAVLAMAHQPAKISSLAVRSISKELLMALIEAGTKAPSFALSNQDEVTVKSDDFAGRYVLLWWYPKASTPG